MASGGKYQNVYGGGNVSRMDWWAFSPEGATRSYVFSYDGLCRLTAADYDDDRGGRGRFSTSYAYDLNGNVTSLLRYGRYSDTQYAPIDDLSLEYTGNRLTRATDSATGPYFQGALHFADNADEETEYAYDANGNTIADLNRSVLSTTYDFNGMPRTMTFADGSANAYVYDATGRKRRTVHRVASAPPSVPGAEPSGFVTMTADYCGDLLYEDSTLTRIDFEGGYLSFSDDRGNALARPEYHFYVRDHLGNNRMDLTESGAITQIVDYYPFGLPMGCSYRPAAQRRLFGGKELDRTAGLNLYDQEARLYDPATGRFTRPDPLSHDYTAVSHYSFCLNNPLILTDPTGRKIDTSGMNEQELDYFNTALDEMKLSKLFGAVWESLSNSEKVYSFKFGKLDNTNVVKGDGQTKETETGCEIILNEQFAQKDENMNSTLAEESFHAYQSDNNDLGADPNFNYEFEAKTFVALYLIERGNGGVFGDNSFANFLVNKNEMGILVDITQSPYPEQYMKAASEFSKNKINYNLNQIKNNEKVVSSNYTAPTTRAPRTLLNLVNSVLHK